MRYIYIVVGVLTVYGAWDILVEVSLTCNQLKSNTCKAKEPCMLISPKDQDLDIQSPSSTSPLPWLSQTNRTSKNLSFPTGPCKNLNSHFTFVSFSLKEGARKLPWVSRSSLPVHTPKRKTKPHPKVFPLSHFLGCPDRKSSSKKEASFNSLKLSTSHTFGSSH